MCAHEQLPSLLCNPLYSSQHPQKSVCVLYIHMCSCWLSRLAPKPTTCLSTAREMEKEERVGAW